MENKIISNNKTHLMNYIKYETEWQVFASQTSHNNYCLRLAEQGVD